MKNEAAYSFHYLSRMFLCCYVIVMCFHKGLYPLRLYKATAITSIVSAAALAFAWIDSSDVDLKNTCHDLKNTDFNKIQSPE